MNRRLPRVRRVVEGALRFREQHVLTLTFPVSGMVTTLLGPLLPVLIAHWSLTDAQAGQFFLSQFLASTAGAVSSGWIAARVGVSRSIGASYGLMGVAVLALGAASRSGGLLCVAIYGFALGVSIPAINLRAAAKLTGSRALAQLNLLNMAWGLGAVLTPPLVVFLLRSEGLAVVLGTVGGLCLVAGSICLTMPSPAASSAGTATEPFSTNRATYSAAIATGLFLFLYVGVENGLNGWLPLFTQRTIGPGAITSAVALSVFWAALLGARLAIASFPQGLRPARLIFYGLALAILGIAVLLAAPAVPGALVAGSLVAGSAVAGLGLGPIFPTAVAIFHERTGATSARLIGFVFAAAGCGGGSVPWLVGTISSASGSLRMGLATTVVAVLGMLVTLRRL